MATQSEPYNKAVDEMNARLRAFREIERQEYLAALQEEADTYGWETL